MEYPKDYIVFKKFDAEIQKVLETGEEFRWLFFGEPGTGKTSLANLVINHIEAKSLERIQKRELIIRRMSSSELYREYLRLHNSEYSDKHDAIYKLQRLLCGGLCLLDDLGNEINTEAAHQFIEEALAIQYDYTKRPHRWTSTIITTNYGRSDLALMYGERIVDRFLEDYVTFAFTNQSFRAGKAKVITNKESAPEKAKQQRTIKGETQ